jgi:phospholipase C
LVRAVTSHSDQSLTLTFGNQGPVGLAYHVRQAGGSAGPWTYTIAPHHTASNIWALGAQGASSVFDLSVYGPNGFYRRYQGSVAHDAANLVIDTEHERRGEALRVTFTNRGASEARVIVTDVYTGRATVETIPARGAFSREWDLAENHRWYDLIVQVAGDSTFRQQLAGHVENGEDSYTDPAMGNPD